MHEGDFCLIYHLIKGINYGHKKNSNNINTFLLLSMMEDAVAGFVPACDAVPDCANETACTNNNQCSANTSPGGPSCSWCGSFCSSEPCPPVPGNCTVSVSGDINDNLVCLCQNQTKKGKDTFQVIECGNEVQQAECERRQGEVKKYINADDSAELFTFDCSEVSCVDVCLGD